MNFFEKLLTIKEERFEIQEQLINEYHSSLITITVNLPGENKRNSTIENLTDDIATELKKIFCVHKHMKRELDTGVEHYIAIDEAASALKKHCIEIEERSPIHRLLDVDVFDKNHKSISRADLNYPPRKCLICDNDAKSCMRMKKHSINELINKIESILTSYKI